LDELCDLDELDLGDVCDDLELACDLGLVCEPFEDEAWLLPLVWVPFELLDWDGPELLLDCVLDEPDELVVVCDEQQLHLEHVDHGENELCPWPCQMAFAHAKLALTEQGADPPLHEPQLTWLIWKTPTSNEPFEL